MSEAGTTRLLLAEVGFGRASGGKREGRGVAGRVGDLWQGAKGRVDDIGRGALVLSVRPIVFVTHTGYGAQSAVFGSMHK